MAAERPPPSGRGEEEIFLPEGWKSNQDSGRVPRPIAVSSVLAQAKSDNESQRDGRRPKMRIVKNPEKVKLDCQFFTWIENRKWYERFEAEPKWHQ